MAAPGVREETMALLRYKVNGRAVMTDAALVRAVASPLESMVRDSSATVASGASRIPFVRSKSNSTLPVALPFINDGGAVHGSAQA